MDDLPALALERVFTFLDDEDVITFGSCCRRSRAASLEDAVWKPRCEAYGVGVPGAWEPQTQLPSCSPQPDPAVVASGSQGEDAADQEEEEEEDAAPAPCHSYRLLYLGLLRQFGQLLHDPSSPPNPGGPMALRLWQATDTPFGGLVTARFEPPSTIVLHSVIVYLLNGPVQSRPILRITPRLPPPSVTRQPQPPCPPASLARPSPATSPSSSASIAPAPVPPGAPPLPPHLLQSLFTLMKGFLRSASGRAPSRPPGPEQQDPAQPSPNDPPPTPPPQAKCCCQLPIPRGGEPELHDATVHMLRPPSSAAAAGAEGFALRCAVGCRHTDFDPLLRHTGGLGAEIDFSAAHIPESCHRWLQLQGQGRRVPEIARQHAQQCFLQFVPHHMRFLYKQRADFAAAAAAAGGGGPQLPPGVPADALLYRAVQVGRGHPLAGLWRGTYNFHGVEILNFVPHASAPADPSAPAPPLPDKLLGFKVTGDANVPAGQVSLELLLPAPHPNPVAAPGCRFVLPPHLSTGVELEALEGLVVQAAYVGRGHIAQTGFQYDEWTEVEMVVFEPGNCLGTVWHELGSFSLFSQLPL